MSVPQCRINYESDLNEEQLEVVLCEGGPILVLAGAGTGKTRTLTYRLVKLLDRGVPPWACLLLTFTNRAAREMLERVSHLLGQYPSGLWGGTFHHVCNLILRRHASLIGYKENYTILDREDQKTLMDACIKDIAPDDPEMPKPAVLVEILSVANSLCLSPEELLERRYRKLLDREDEILKVLNLYHTKKLTQNLMDFDDLLINCLKLLEEHPELARHYGGRFEHILVDEYQDTNPLQARFVDILAGVHRNLMVVGDDAQAIYSFRGASIENILRFHERYPDCRIFKLTTNYRSRPEVLALANEIIVHNRGQFEKALRTSRPHGPKPVVVRVYDTRMQAGIVAEIIERAVAEGVPLSEIAVLYRAHYQSLEVQVELQARGISFQVRSGLRFFEQAHVKDLLTYLRVLYNPYDEINWKRLLKMVPGIGDVTTQKLWQLIQQSQDVFQDLKQKGPRMVLPKARDAFNLVLAQFDEILKMDYKNRPEDVLEYVLENSYSDYLYHAYPNAESRYEDLLQLIQYVRHYPVEQGPHNKLELLLNDLALERTEEEEVGTFVSLSSVHQAKGLEWQLVILIGMNEGRFPSKRAILEEDIEEERRLFYVATTRAKDFLYIIYTVTDNGFQTLKKSRFLGEIPKDLYEEVFLDDRREF